ncbi:MAG: QueT transporter family protein [Actinomycetia bacterium]|nr:QueT transporter family protein [Actinomycetes bacterium]
MPCNNGAKQADRLDAPTRTALLAQTGLIAAIYATLTFLVVQTMGYLSWGPVQFRISEALTILPLFFPAAVPGLALGCVIGNALSLGVTGPLGWLDVVFGTLATLLGAIWTYKLREHTWLALLGPVLTNALIVPAYLPLILAGLGFYTIPFTQISMENSYGLMYLFGVVCVAVGQAAVVFGIGIPLATILRRVLMPVQ